MASIVEISDPDDPRLADYRDLRDAELRQSVEAEHGLFLAEGKKVVRRAVRGRVPGTVVPAGAPMARGPRRRDRGDRGALLRGLRGARRAGHRLPRASRRAGVAGRRKPLPTRRGGARRVLGRVVVCEDIVDHTNLGAIFRSAAAMGVDGRAARAPVRRPALPTVGQGGDGGGLRAALDPAARLARRGARLAERGFTTVALTLSADAVPLDEAVAGLNKVALVLGSEGHGLSARWERRARRRAVIPMRPGVDSLNVAAARAMACYETARRRIGPPGEMSPYPFVVGLWGSSARSSSSMTWSTRSPTTRSSGWTRRQDPVLEPRRGAASRATPPRRPSAATSRCSTRRRTGERPAGPGPR